MNPPSLRPAAGARDQFAFTAIVAESAAMREVLRMADRVATTPLRSMLLTGEAGTDKELLAHCIHNASLHATDPFITINCAAIPAAMLEVELFGSEGRAAAPRRRGALELAARGTVFLDEVAELPMALQARLHRSLEDFSIPRIGGNEQGEPPIHCRVIAATKYRLDERVNNGQFREDLLARLAVLRIELPPLRDRQDDVLRIAEHVLNDLAGAGTASRKQLGLDATSVLRAHRWPGNVRELKYVIERAASACDESIIGARHLVINQQRAGAIAVQGVPTFGEIRIPPEGKRLRDIEAEALGLTLRLTDFNQSAAARILRISRPTLARKQKTYGLNRPSGR